MKKGRVEIDRGRCKGCYLCIRACPLHLLEKDSAPGLDGSYPAKMTDNSKCIACGSCYTVCPDCAITIFEGEA
jgi:2-oxoglutarate ferredoxin oxidoreductase subunit delta